MCSFTQTCVLGQWGACNGSGAPSAEACDGVDNDCNGLVDDGMNLCAAGKVCDRGACVDRCVEQGCPVGMACNGNGVS